MKLQNYSVNPKFCSERVKKFFKMVGPIKNKKQDHILKSL